MALASVSLTVPPADLADRARMLCLRGCLLATTWLAACRGDAQPGSADAGAAAISVEGGVAFDAVFATADSVVLEEPPGVVNVRPSATMDVHGGFIVVDQREDQVRLYSRTGALERAYGPGTGRLDSLAFLVRAVRRPDGTILVASLGGSLTAIQHDDAGQAWTIRTALFRLRDILLLDDRRVLLVGLDSAPATALLHVWDAGSHAVVRRFFPPPAQFDAGVIGTFPTVAVARRGSRLAAAYTFSDTLVVFDTAGVELSRRRIPIDPFVAPGPTLPPITSPLERQAWVNQFTAIQDVFWVDDDQLLVQWAKGTPQGVQWGLLGMDTVGNRAWAIAPAPRLVGVQDGHFVFEHPGGGAPNRWIIARRR
jgi:hypothetical protein